MDADRQQVMRRWSSATVAVVSGFSRTRFCRHSTSRSTTTVDGIDRQA